MQLGMVGLGKMGASMTLRLVRGGHEVVVYDVSSEAVQATTKEGAIAASSLDDMVSKLAPARAVWVMVPAGDITAATIAALGASLEAGDTIIDGGNSRYIDSIERADSLKKKGIHFADVGTSGGIWGLDEGYCLMAGCSEETFSQLEPIFATLAPEGGCAHVGPNGAGHFVKMVHNGIEYALMQGYGEGFELLHRSPLDLDVGKIAELWRHGSVVRSWLLDLAASALSKDPGLEKVSDFVADSGEGRWTLQNAIEAGVPTPAIASALFTRFSSQQDQSFSGKVIAALRREFGGHAVKEVIEEGPPDLGA